MKKLVVVVGMAALVGCADGGPGGPDPVPDAGSTPRVDAAVDAGGDARPDAGRGDDAGSDGGVTMDAGPDGGHDAGPGDASPSDVGHPDASLPDAGAMDGGELDGGIVDAGLVDAGFVDAGHVDAGAMCPDETFDDDGDPATPCRPWTVCVPGEFVSVAGTPVSDRSCAPCPAGTSSVETNALACLDPCERIVGVTCSAYAEAYVKATDPGAMDGFGDTIDIDGDTMVVGAPFESSDATGVNGSGANDRAFRSGAAYVYVRTGTTWSPQAYLKASNTGAYDGFGEAVAISADTIVIGAGTEDSMAGGINGNGADDTYTDSGAAYVFVRSGTTWTQQAYVKASNPRGSAWFGRSVDIDGDTLAVGAWHEPSGATGVNGNQNDTSLSGSGAVYVFTRTGAVWAQQAYVKASNPGQNDEFGHGLAIDQDTLVVGAPSESSGADGIGGNQTDDSTYYAGAAYVFARSGVTWSQQAYVKASRSDAYDYFGDAVDVSGDTIVVGAPGESSTAPGVGASQTVGNITWTGAVYVFTRAAGVWSQQEFIKPAVTGAYRFGLAVALDADTLLVGAPFEGSPGVDLSGDPTVGGAFASGAAYLFTRSSTTAAWRQRAYVKASNTQASDGFGGAVALSTGTFVVTAPQEDSSASGVGGDQTNNTLSDSGAAYVRRFVP